MTQSNPKKYVVTGGGGFVGFALCRSLRNDGHSVVSIARGDYPQLRALGVECVRADLSADPVSWEDALRGAHGVFHTAAKVDMWGVRDDFYRINVEGTKNVIQACRSMGVGHLVFTSSPSVVHTGADLLHVDESQPIATHFDAFYPETKAIAEKEVLASESDALHVVALRPHLIWGPHDTNLIPAILKRAKSGSLRRVGDGRNLVDLTFIDDCIMAHRLAMNTLETDPKRCAGKAYFISQGDPVRLWGWIDQILEVHDLPKVEKSVSLRTALLLAGLCERCSKILHAFGCSVAPRFSKFLVSEMATSHYFDISRAKADLGFAPSMTIAEAMDRTFRSSVAAGS